MSSPSEWDRYCSVENDGTPFGPFASFPSGVSAASRVWGRNGATKSFFRGWIFEKSAWRRFLILSAGAALNILLAVGITAFLLMTRGVMDLKSTTIGEIMTEYPAAEAGLRQGDTILAVNDEPATSWEHMAMALREADTTACADFVERESDRFTVEQHCARIPSPVSSFSAFVPDHHLSFFEPWTLFRLILKESGHPVGYSLMAFWKQKRTSPARSDRTMAGEAVKQGLWPFFTFSQ
jgi:regulator of sigma E protease